jgi:hypothetical protein
MSLDRKRLPPSSIPDILHPTFDKLLLYACIKETVSRDGKFL